MNNAIPHTLAIGDLATEQDMDAAQMAGISGGMRKLPFQRTNISDLLMSPDGEPVSVYVDGVLVNSVTTGYAPR
jgi:hypothetical protein